MRPHPHLSMGLKVLRFIPVQVWKHPRDSVGQGLFLKQNWWSRYRWCPSSGTGRKWLTVSKTSHLISYFLWDSIVNKSSSRASLNSAASMNLFFSNSCCITSYRTDLFVGELTPLWANLKYAVVQCYLNYHIFSKKPLRFIFFYDVDWNICVLYLGAVPLIQVDNRIFLHSGTK